MIIRRVPFGRVYAIRRELEAQCLGLIRDGNTSTIVDVVPNSLAARFGLPPKVTTAQFLSFLYVNHFFTTGQNCRWTEFNILGVDRNQWTTPESLFQRH